MVAPPAAAGSVQFKDGTDNIDSPVPLSNGTATTITGLALGTHSLTAEFTPTDPTAFSPSTSPAVMYVISPVSRVGGHDHGADGDTGVARGGGHGADIDRDSVPVGRGWLGAVQRGADNIGNPVLVSNGTATAMAMATLAVGTRSLTAMFTPEPPTSMFASSTSAAVSYVVNTSTGAKATTTRLRVAPNPAFQHLPVVLFATVAPGTAAGTVQFEDGTTRWVRRYRCRRPRLPHHQGAGDRHTPLTAVFTPANPAVFSPSTSPPVTLTVDTFPPS